MLTIILLLLLFIFICGNITNNIERFQNLNDLDLSKDTDNKDKEEEELKKDNKKNDNKIKEEECNVEIIVSEYIDKKKHKKKKDKKHKDKKHKDKKHKDKKHKDKKYKYKDSEIKGYDNKIKAYEKTPSPIDRNFLMDPTYLQYGNALGSIDHAKISKNIFADMVPDCYTLLKEKYISFPLQRYNVTDLANMGVYK